MKKKITQVGSMQEKKSSFYYFVFLTLFSARSKQNV